MRSKIASVLAVATVAALFAIPNAAIAGCGFENDGELSRNKINEPAHANGDVNTVEVNEFNQYTVDLGPGTHYVVLQGAGDLDLTVCKGSSISNECTSHNAGPLVDGCLVQGAEGNPGMGTEFSGPGTYKIQVRHCTNDACGYDLATSIDDVVPALAYSITWVTI